MKKIHADGGDDFFLTRVSLREDTTDRPYRATRKEIRRAFYGVESIPYFIGSHPMVKYPAPVSTYTDSIVIGCQAFSGKNFTALKKWALGSK